MGMTDTTVPIVAINLANTTITSMGVVVFGVHTGLDYPTLLAGVFGGALALSYMEKCGLVDRAIQVISASLFAGYVSPIAAEIVLHKLIAWELIAPSTDTKMGIQVALATLVGYTAHGIILPGLRKILKTRLRRAANE